MYGMLNVRKMYVSTPYMYGMAMTFFTTCPYNWAEFEPQT